MDRAAGRRTALRVLSLKGPERERVPRSSIHPDYTDQEPYRWGSVGRDLALDMRLLLLHIYAGFGMPVRSVLNI